MAALQIAVCARCRHFRQRPPAELYSQADLQAPAVLKAKLEEEQQEQEHRQIEMQRFEAGQPFSYEPSFYAWCAAFTPFDGASLSAATGAAAGGDVEGARRLAADATATVRSLADKAKGGDTEAMLQLMHKGAGTMDPVSGEVMPYYGLCAHINPTGQCPAFEPPVPAAPSGGATSEATS